MEDLNILAYGSPLVGVYGVSKDFSSHDVWRHNEFLKFHRQLDFYHEYLRNE